MPAKIDLSKMTVQEAAQLASDLSEHLKAEAAKPKVAEVACNGPKEGELAVVICTNLRGVFFGYALAADLKTGIDQIKLRSARNAFYWKASEGILELGATGPKTGSKIGARADIELRGISCVIQCTPEALREWESKKWA